TFNTVSCAWEVSGTQTLNNIEVSQCNMRAGTYEVTCYNNSNATMTTNGGYIHDMGNNQWKITDIPTGTALIINMDFGDSCYSTFRIDSPICPCEVKVYNLFSPNGDGINDHFEIECIENYPNNTLEVYSRHGLLVYKKQGYLNEWNGESMGRMTVDSGRTVPTGTYYYILDLGNGSKPIVGWLYVNQ
ncbi:hypothetical protein CHU92_09705, partial [Flavobacterium cyanobacteriorum]